MTDPADLWAVGADGKGGRARHASERGAARRSGRGPVSERFVKSADGRSLQAWLFQPPGFDPSKKYPAIFFVHGGPQVPVTDAWSYRWNLALFASYGYVVYAPNPRGSPGCGQKFVDEISGDWGGKVYDDLMRQADDLEALPYVDKKKIGAAGASYGGYMIAWLAGHTTRFATLVCHDGTVDLAPANLATEELWFPKVEFGGWPWESGADYDHVEPDPLRRQVPDADARHPQREGLSRPVRPGSGVLHGAPAEGRAFEVRDVPRRGALGPEARKRPLLAQRHHGLAAPVPGRSGGGSEGTGEGLQRHEVVSWRGFIRGATKFRELTERNARVAGAGAQRAGQAGRRLL